MVFIVTSLDLQGLLVVRLVSELPLSSFLVMEGLLVLRLAFDLFLITSLASLVPLFAFLELLVVEVSLITSLIADGLPRLEDDELCESLLRSLASSLNF